MHGPKPWERGGHPEMGMDSAVLLVARLAAAARELMQGAFLVWAYHRHLCS